MRNFTQFIKSEKETRLDVHAFDLEKKEGDELSEILKNMEFTFCYMESDSLLAFLTGGFTRIKEIMKELELCCGFSWDGDPAIIGVSEGDLRSDENKWKRKKETIY